MVIIQRKKYNLCKVNFEWLVDIINDYTDNCTEFWLSHPMYGIKLFMFGIPSEEIEEINKITENLEGLIIPYKREYELRFMDETEDVTNEKYEK